MWGHLINVSLFIQPSLIATCSARISFSKTTSSNWMLLRISFSDGGWATNGALSLHECTHVKISTTTKVFQAAKIQYAVKQLVGTQTCTYGSMSSSLRKLTRVSMAKPAWCFLSLALLVERIQLIILLHKGVSSCLKKCGIKSARAR